MEEIPPSNPGLIPLMILWSQLLQSSEEAQSIDYFICFFLLVISNHSSSTSSFLLKIKCTQISPIVKKKIPQFHFPFLLIHCSCHTDVCCKSCFSCYFSFISHLILNPIKSSFLPPPSLWNYFLYIYQPFVNEIDKHLVMRKDVLIQYWVKKIVYKA